MATACRVAFPSIKERMTDKTLLQPTMLLVRPQMGENIGAAARAMWNFGLDHMRIVDPRDGWPSQKAVVMASGAGRLLDEARLFDTTADALADTTFVMATTARIRDLTKPIFSPEHAMAEAARRIADGQNVAVMFGPERAGVIAPTRWAIIISPVSKICVFEFSAVRFVD